MKTTDYALQKVYSLIKASEFQKPTYKLTKPSKKSHAEYIVLNALPIGPGVLQKCYVNVNYHVKDLSSGMPDLAKLEAGTTTLMTFLEEVTETAILIDFESQEYFREEALGEHYSNIRLSVKILNTE